MQTIISIIGLAVGFTCFSLATLWMRYETSYDSFHKNAKHLYVATTSSLRWGIERNFPPEVPVSLKETFPEVKEAIPIAVLGNSRQSVIIGELREESYIIMTNSTFLTMFDIKILEGSLDFTNPLHVAITKEKAQKFGKESPIGKEFSMFGENYTITAVVSGYSVHSNYPFDFLGAFPPNYSVDCLLELHPNVDVEAFKKKLYEHKGTYQLRGRATEVTNISLIPLTILRIEGGYGAIKFQHIKLFAWSSVLVILCALFNYLTLFVSRFKIRGKELALRIVCGASLWSLFSLLLIEFLITLFAATLLGLVVMNFILPEFQNLSKIYISISSIYAEMILYILLLILLTILLFAFTLAVFRKVALNVSIRHTNNKLFRKISIVVQLVISIGFVFCTSIMIKQVRYLHNSPDIGFEYKNRASFFVNTDADAVVDKMKQIPEITDVVTGYTLDSWHNIPFKGEDGNEQSMRYVCISKAFAELYGWQLIAGEMLAEENPNNILINESALKLFGWHKDEAVGKHFQTYTVKGIVKNIYDGSLTVEVDPMLYYYGSSNGENIAFKHTNFKVARTKIMELMKKDFPDLQMWNLSDAETEYKSYFFLEKTLIMMLNIMTSVCVLISIFGFFSLVSLSCEEKRKEIAIRKVNGADIHDIIAIFFKEYSLLLTIGAAIAFPIGYYIMKGWLEQYINKTSIDAWVYAAILLAFAFIIILCVGWRVYKTSRENPADVVKSE